MKDIGHATQLFLLALLSLVGYCVLVSIHVHAPDLFQLLREVILAALVGGSVAVPPRAAADVTVSGPVNVDSGPLTSSGIHPDTPQSSDL